MKLEDIKLAIQHSAEVELQRAIYNASAVLDYSKVMEVIAATIDDVYDSGSSDTSEDN